MCHRLTRGLCERAGFAPTIAYETDDVAFTAALINAGAAVAVMPDLLVVTAPVPAVTRSQTRRWGHADLRRAPRALGRSRRRRRAAGAASIDGVDPERARSDGALRDASQYFVGMTEILGACPLDCPDTLQLGGDRRGRRGRQAARQPRPPVHRGRAVREGQPLPRAHARARPAPAPAAARRRARARAGSSGSRWDEALDEIAARLRAVIERVRRRGDLAVSRARARSGYIQGLEGRAGARLWNVLGASRHDMTICSVAGRVGRRRTRPARPAGMDPETFAQSKLILLWGTNTLTSGHHLWKFIQAAREERRARGGDRPDAHPHGRAGRRAPRAAARAPTPRSRSGCCDVVLDEGARGPATTSREHTRRLGRVPRAHPRVPAGPRGRDHRAAGGAASSRSGERLAHDPADRDPRDDGHAAPRRRRHGAAHADAASRA